MILLGLTGGIAAGKSYVGRLIARRGIPVIDADVLAREAVSPGSEGFREVSRAFPRAIRQGEIDRAALGRIVFSDPVSLSRLEGIIHPRVRQAFYREKERLRDEPVVVYEVPLLFERGIDREVDSTLVVDVPESLQLTRLLARPHMTEEEAKRRMASQIGRQERLSRADFIISGSLSEEETEKELSRILGEIMSQPPKLS
ncbi:MAG: dephospho-CoA kinase [Nitrospirae bacterium]|nr:dephospho-CoA kinase [Nitrospirota bacterium]